MLALVNACSLAAAREVEIALEHVTWIDFSATGAIARVSIAPLTAVVVLFECVERALTWRAWPTTEEERLIVAVTKCVISLPRIQVTWVKIARH